MVRQCNFCSTSDAGYICPKCGLAYCSLNCYRHRDHLECSELFYKDLVLEELARDSQSNKQMREVTLKLLQKIKLEDESQPELSNLLSNSDNNKQSSSGLISPITDEHGIPVEERAKFDKLVQTGGIFNLLPANFWDPWYIKLSQDLLLKDHSSNSCANYDEETTDHLNDKLKKDSYQSFKDNDDDYEDCVDDDDNEDIPSYPTDLPKLAEITNKEPSPLIKSSLIQTIFAYSTICRYFVGSHHSYPIEPYDLLIKLSSLDSSKISFPTTNQCLQFASRHLIEHVKLPLCFIEKLYLDTTLIIKHGNRLVLRCLVDIVQLCKGAIKRTKVKENTTGIKKIIKKMKFYMCWCSEKEKLYQAELPAIQFEALAFKQLTHESQEINSNIKHQTPMGEVTSQTDRKLIEVIESVEPCNQLSGSK